MSAQIIVMLIWIGVTGNLHSGAAATIPGFSSLDSCNAAAAQVHKFYDGWWYRASTQCVALSR